MRTERQINEARELIARRILETKDHAQRTLLSGILLGLAWAAGRNDLTTVEDVLNGRPFAKAEPPHA